MGAYTSNMPTDNSQDTGILSFLDTLIKQAGQAYTISQGGSVTQNKNIYQNTASPNQSTLTMGGFTTGELIGLLLIGGLAVALVFMKK